MLISRILSLCNKQRKLNIGETLSLKMKGERVFTSQERQIDRGKMLTVK